MSAAREIIWLKEVERLDRHLVGDRGVVLGELMRAKFPVVDGFVITPEAGDRFVQQIEPERIEGRWMLLKSSQGSQREKVVKEMRKIVQSTVYPKDLEQELIRAYNKLSGRWAEKRVRLVPVVVGVGKHHQGLQIAMEPRYAGGEAEMLEEVRKLWSEGFGGAMEVNTKHFKSAQKIVIGVVVQVVEDDEARGKLLTMNPETGEKNSLVIEVIGKGKEPAEYWEVNKYSMTVVNKRGDSQAIHKSRPWWQGPKQNQRLSEKQMLKLAKIGIDLEHHLASPQEIEWVLSKGTIEIVSTKPLAGLHPRERGGLPREEKVSEAIRHLNVLASGVPASKGLVSGYARVITKLTDVKNLKKGEIVVTETWEKSLTPILKKAKGLILESGDVVSQGAVLSRELGLPAVVGVEIGKIRTGWLVTVNGWSGQIYRGGVKLSSNKLKVWEPAISGEMSKMDMPVNTATRILTSVDGLGMLEAAAQPSDGVCLESNRFFKQMETHPKVIVKDGKSQQVVDDLTKMIAEGCRAFHGRQIVYVTSSLSSKDYQRMRGARLRETGEDNPLLGSHGVTRHLRVQGVFDWEMKAIKRVRNKLGYKNINVALTGVRHLKNLLEIKKQMAGVGLNRTASLKLWMVVETPGMAAGMREMARGGIDGVMIDMDRLSQLWQGLDKHNEMVNRFYNLDDPTMDGLLENLVKLCNKLDLLTIVWYGSQMPSERMLTNWVKWGVEAIGVRSAGVKHVRELVGEAEKRVIVNKN